MDEKLKSIQLWIQKTRLRTSLFMFLFVLISASLIQLVFDTNDFFEDIIKEMGIIIVGSIIFGLLGFFFYKVPDEKQ